MLITLVSVAMSYPRLLFQTTDKPLDVPEKVRYNMETHASGWNRTVVDDAGCIEHISVHHPDALQAFYSTVRGEHKADLCRATLLYTYGGAYLDIKTILLDDLDSIAKRGGNAPLTTVLDPSGVAIHNGFMIATPRHPIMLAVIRYFIRLNGRIASYHDVIRYMYQFMRLDRHNTYYLLTEKCGTTSIETHGRIYASLDRYCLNCMIYAGDSIVIKTRYVDYPWGSSPRSNSDVACILKHRPFLFYLPLITFLVVPCTLLLVRQGRKKRAPVHCPCGGFP